MDVRCGQFIGNEREYCQEFLGIRYARAGRYEYPVPVWSEEKQDARAYGASCTQSRIWYEHLEIPERAFYHREFRNGQVYRYSEDCLFLNVFKPKTQGKYPVVVFIHGGGFNSGSSEEWAYDGEQLTRQGLVVVTINYRVGVLGYLTHEALKEEYGHDGNFAIADQFCAIHWIKDHIALFDGDPENITLMGQSAGAMSIQYMSLCEESIGLYRRAIMLSGGGLPRFAMPLAAEKTREFWLELMEIAGCRTIDELKVLDAYSLFTAVEKQKSARTDTLVNTMPVLDGWYFKAPIEELIRTPAPIDYMLGYTSNDMFTKWLAYDAHEFAIENRGYIYCFDIPVRGDDNGAFHTVDVRYVFGTLDRHSSYSFNDYEHRVSGIMQRYVAAFARTGDPNEEGLPIWTRGGMKELRIDDGFHMCYPDIETILKNTLRPDPV